MFKTHYKKLQSLIENPMQQEGSESAEEQRIALYKSHQQSANRWRRRKKNEGLGGLQEAEAEMEEKGSKKEKKEKKKKKKNQEK